MASATQTLMHVGGLFVGFSGDIHCNLLQKSDLQLERVFSFSLPTDYGLLVTGQFIIIQRQAFYFQKDITFLHMTYSRL